MIGATLRDGRDLETARFEHMLRVEIEVARAGAVRGRVPADALAAIEARARVDVARIAEIEKTTDHDVIAFVSQVAESVGPEGRYLHLGLTSSDVVDTGLALQLRAAGRCARWAGSVDHPWCPGRGET
jgi:adenylosuccinate lyase